MGGIGQNLQLPSDGSVLLGHHTKLTHAKFCDKICHILQVMGKMSVPAITNLFF